MADRKFDLDAFSSVLEIYPSGDPYEETTHLLKKVAYAESHGWKQSHFREDSILEGYLEGYQAGYQHALDVMHSSGYLDGLNRDLGKISGDFVNAEKKFYNLNEKYSEQKLNSSTEGILSNDKEQRFR